MYQIFVVEDELLIRQRIRTTIEEMSGPFSFCGEASDGEMALSMMQDIMPDIVLTDIRMPFLDGFGLISQLKSMMPWIKIIIISGYGDFEYAQKAISLGVDQYLLKPVRGADLVKAVSDCAARIEQERAQEKNTAGFDSDEVQQALYQHFMKNLLHGELDTSNVLDQARKLNLNIVYPYYQLVVFSFDSEGFDHRQLRTEGAKLIRDLSLSFTWYNGSDRFTVLLNGQNADDITEDAYRIITIVRHELQRISPVITAVISNVVNRVSSIPDAYITAKDLVKKISGVAAGRVVDASDTAQISTEILGYSNLLDERFHLLLAAAEPETIPVIVDTYLESEDGAQYDSMLIRYNTLVNVLKLAAQMISSETPGTDAADVAAKLSSQYNILSLVGRRDTFRDAMVDILREVISQRRKQQVDNKYRHVISRAMEYIHENYCDANISLIAVSRHVNISSAHFSTIFSQTMGTTFINYLTEIRMTKAKELLRDTDMKLAAIAMEVGYNEPNYFSHVFRKNTGMTPKEYRNGLGE